MSILTDGVDDILDPILAVFNEELTATVEGQAVTAYLRGSTEMVTWARTARPGVSLPFEGPPIEQAIDYARKRGARLVTDMNEETKARLAKVIGDGIESKRGIPGLARDIRNEFEDMARNRSRTIARTETSDALEQAFMDRAKDLGVTGKEWIPVDPEDQDCIGNGAAGVIAIDEDFPSGHDRPPAHPNCRCALAPVMR